MHPNISIGEMDVICPYCNALKFSKEAPGMCCSNGKVKLNPIVAPPEPLSSLMSNNTTESKHFLNNIRKYNSSFQMTSFGATKIENDRRYLPTFRIQGQIYHRIGSLLPMPGDDHKFLQIYFIGNEEEEIDQRCSIAVTTNRDIITKLQEFFHKNNDLVNSFKTALEKMPPNNYKVVIRADKTPLGEHKGRFNAPIPDDIAVVMTGTDYEGRDIIIEQKNTVLQRVTETHQFYDALQYPIILWNGDEGYHFNIMQTNPITGQPLSKKVMFFINTIK